MALQLTPKNGREVVNLATGEVINSIHVRLNIFDVDKRGRCFAEIVPYYSKAVFINSGQKLSLSGAGWSENGGYYCQVETSNALLDIHTQVKEAILADTRVEFKDENGVVYALDDTYNIEITDIPL